MTKVLLTFEIEVDDKAIAIYASKNADSFEESSTLADVLIHGALSAWRRESLTISIVAHGEEVEDFGD